MHRALLRINILREVLEHIAIHDPPDNRTTLISTAVTCKSFMDPSMAVLWRELDDFRPLMMLFSGMKSTSVPLGGLPIPKVHLNLTHGYWFPYESTYHDRLRFRVGNITQAEWERFQYYASFVHKITANELNIVDPLLFSTLKRHATGEPVLPALKELEWAQIYDLNTDAGLSTLWTDKLQSLHVTMRHPKWCYTEQEDDTIIDGNLPPVCWRFIQPLPELRTLSLTCVPVPLTLKLVTAVPNVTDLQYTERTIVDNRLLSPFATLKGLRSLSLHVKGAQRDLEFHPFHVLESLSLSTDGDPAAITRILCAMDAPNVWDLHVWRKFTASKNRSFDDALSLLRCIQMRLGNSLTAIQYYVYISVDAEALIDLLSPLMALRHLKSVDLQVDRGVFIADHAVEALAKSWPDLRSLVLDRLDRRTDAVSPSTLSLVHLARYCPHLHRLQIYFDDKETFTVEQIDNDVPVRQALSCLVPCGRQPEDASATTIAAVIARLYPCVAIDPDHDSDQDFWESVTIELGRLQASSHGVL